MSDEAKLSNAEWIAVIQIVGIVSVLTAALYGAAYLMSNFVAPAVVYVLLGS